jgi:hypothetical protein
MHCNKWIYSVYSTKYVLDSSTKGTKRKVTLRRVREIIVVV